MVVKLITHRKDCLAVLVSDANQIANRKLFRNRRFLSSYSYKNDAFSN